MTTDDIRTETSFEVDDPPEVVWARLERLRTDHSVETGQWWLPGFECRCTEVVARPVDRLEVVKAEHPCKDTTIVVTFEHAGSGSRIHIVQSGFDPSFVAMTGEQFWSHAAHINADAELFFRTGVIAGRAWRPWAMLGFEQRAEPYGLVVTAVSPDTWAARLGLTADDIVLDIDGAPIFDRHDLDLVERVVRSGDEVGALWVRGSERLAGTAAL